MRDLEIATHPSQSWQLGGILREFQWEGEPSTVALLLGGDVEVNAGDRVTVLYRGLPMAHFIAVEPKQ